MTQALPRILFLFNHDAAHQAAHIAGIMAELALSHPKVKVVAGTGTPVIEAHLRTMIGEQAAAALEWLDLSLSTIPDALLAPVNRILPAKRLARLRTNEAAFAQCDIIVSTERTCLRVRRRLRRKIGDDAPRFVYVPHGSGDRNVAYHPELAQFDYHFLSGRKLIDEMVAHGLAQESQCRLIGYPKFDVVPEKRRLPMFDNDLPTIIYNPHFDPHLSSWYDHGTEFLTRIAGMGDRFNCVFAPHVMLFRKRLHISPEYKVARRRPDIPEAARSAPNIHIDVDGPSLFDMTYTSGADIYVGDVSSQVYEFLRDPGLCLFIDAAHQGEAAYPFWANGPVVADVANAVAKLADHEALAKEYRPAQDRLFAYTINHDPKRTALVRGALALAQIAENRG